MSDGTDNDANRTGFGDRLRQAMAGRFTQERLAESLGTSLSGVKKWLSGEHEPRASIAWEIAKKCDVSPDWLIAGVEPMRRLDGSTVNPESSAAAAAGDSAAPNGEVVADIIEMAGKITGAVFQILKEERLLRDFYGHEFGELTKAFLRIETHFGIRKDFTPDMDSYRKLMSAKKK